MGRICRKGMKEWEGKSEVFASLFVTKYRFSIVRHWSARPQQLQSIWLLVVSLASCLSRIYSPVHTDSLHAWCRLFVSAPSSVQWCYLLSAIIFSAGLLMPAAARVSGCCMVSLRALVSWHHVHRGHVGGSVTRLFVRSRLHACDEQLGRHDRCAVTCVSLEGHDGVTDWRQTRAWTHWTCIGATILWDPWDASPPSLEIMRTNCIWSPLAFATGCHFVVVRCCGKQTSLVKLRGEGKKSREGNGWNTETCNND